MTQPRRHARPTLRRIAAAGVAALGLLIAGLRPAAASEPDTEPDLRPREVRGMEIENRLGEQIPLDLTFTNVDGSTVRLGDFFNRSTADGRTRKPVVLLMAYYSCPILCPMVLEKFTKTLNEIDFTAGVDYDAVVVSFDPRDKPADAILQRTQQLLFYKQPTTDAIRDGWTFLTCDQVPMDARKLGDALGFPFRYLPEVKEYSHGAAVFILTPEGKLSRTLLGLEYPPRDVRLALLEASEGRIGSLVDRFTLWCYHYDPSKGGYTLIALRVMQIGAGLGALVLIGFIVSLLAWERRKRRGAAGKLDPSASPAEPGRAASFTVSA